MGGFLDRLTISRAGRSLCISILTFAVLLWGAETWFRRSRTHRRALAASSYLRRPASLRQQRGALDVVVFGSSLQRAAISPRELFDAGIDLCGYPIQSFNMAVPAGYGRVTLAMADQVVARARRKPRLALVYEYARSASSELESQPEHLKGDGALGRVYRFSALPSMIRAGFPFPDLARTIFTASSRLLVMRAEVLKSLKGSPPRPTKADYPNYRGWNPLRAVPASLQQKRMETKQAHERRFFSGKARYFDRELRALDEALGILGGHGIRSVLIDSPTSSRMRDVQEPTAIYRRYRQRMSELARGHGIDLLDHRRPPILTDDVFADEHHVSYLGAERYTRWLAEQVIAPRLGCRPPPRPACRPIAAPGDTGWTLSGSFSRRVPPNIGGKDWLVGRGRGAVLLSGDAQHLDGTGRAESAEFTIDSPNLVLYVAGLDQGRARLELWSEGRRLRKIASGGTTVIHPVTVTTTDWIGKRARIRLLDSDRRGFLAFDGARQCGEWAERSGDRRGR